MKPSLFFSPVVVACLIFASPSFAQMMSAAESESSKVSFEAVQPVLRKHCVRCHNEDQPRGDLSLTTLDKVLAGSSSGPVVVFGRVEESPLYTLTAHLDNPKMPPNKPRIPQSELNLIERWIATGLEEQPKPTSTESKKDRSFAEVAEATSMVLEELRPLAQPTPTKAIAVHPLGNKAVVAGLHQVVILDMEHCVAEPNAIQVGEKDVSALRFSPDGKYLFIGAGVPGESGSVLVLDWGKRLWLPSLGNESDLIQAIDCDRDAKQIAIGTTARTVKTFDRESQREIRSHTKHTDWVMSVAYSPEGILLASGDRFGGIHVWESESGKEFATLRGHTGAVTGLAWSQDGNQLISASTDGSIRTWDMHKLESQHQWIAHEKGALALTSMADGTFVTSGRDRAVRQWSIKGERMAELQTKSEIIALVSDRQAHSGAETILSTEAAGGIYRMIPSCFAKDAKAKPLRIDLPVKNTGRSFAVRAPAIPARAALVDTIKNKSDAMDRPSSEPNVDSVATSSGSATEQITRQSDLEEARRTLKSLEASLEQTYRSAEQLEESVARMKQWIALQEAREKQADLRQKPNRK